MQSVPFNDITSGEILQKIKANFAAINSREQLADSLNGIVRDLLPLSHVCALVFDKTNGYERYLINHPTLRSDQSVPTFEVLSQDSLVKLWREIAEPCIVDIEELSQQITLPIYLSANRAAGIKHILVHNFEYAGISCILILYLKPDSVLDAFTLNNLHKLVFELSPIVANLYSPQIAHTSAEKLVWVANLCNTLSNIASESELKDALEQICYKAFGRNEFVIWLQFSGREASFTPIENICLPGTDHRKLKSLLAKIRAEQDQAFDFRKNQMLRFKSPFAAMASTGLVNEDLIRWTQENRILHLPLHSKKNVIGYLWVFADHREPEIENVIASLVAMNLHHLDQQRLLSIEKKRANDKVKSLKSTTSYPGITSPTPQMKRTYEHLVKAASSDVTVMLTGETGTGKNLLANTIHHLSGRKHMPFIVVNCASLAPDMIESELFGHEKGSFTGAVSQRVGKFEQADGGTLFLDEIGELPHNLQVKLLRAIQDREIERIGSKSAFSVNIRIIASTSRNLQTEIQNGRFRSDLFFRLNTFQIGIPALRERRDDIPALISIFLDKYTKIHRRPAPTLPKELVTALMNYNWPGNVRQLEYLIEKVVVLSSEELIFEAVRMEIELENEKKLQSIKTLSEVERDHILAILKLSAGKISGPGGAAEILSIPATTLKSKIKRLGIRKRFYL